MQNKPNFRKAKMNVSIYKTMTYEKYIPLVGQKNKPNSNPIKPNLRKAKMDVNAFITKDYRKNDDFTVRINKPNFRNGQNERKVTYNKGLQKKRCFRRPKNKPNSNPISKQLVGAGPRRPESAKMAQKIDVLKHQNIILKKSNFLYPNRLNGLSQHNHLTGTSFAHLEYMR